MYSFCIGWPGYKAGNTFGGTSVAGLATANTVNMYVCVRREDDVHNLWLLRFFLSGGGSCVAALYMYSWLGWGRAMLSLEPILFFSGFRCPSATDVSDL